MKPIETISLLAVLLVTAGCTYDTFELAGPPPEEEISFASEVLPIFKEGCVGADCHSPGHEPPALTAEMAYDELTNGKNCKEGKKECVDVDDPEGSQILYRMNSTSFPMPPDGRLGGDKIETVLWWIAQGAKDN